MSYELEESVKSYIQEKLNIEPELIQKVYDFFINGVKNHEKHGIKYQYLAHLQRALEGIMRDKSGNPLFTIALHKLPEDDQALEVGTAQYNKNKCFIVYYHPKLDDKQLRVCLAHELGHLFLAVLFDYDSSKENTEPISTLFGIFKILDKDHFYRHEARDYCHKTPENVIDSFVQMNNRKLGKYNSS